MLQQTKGRSHHGAPDRGGRRPSSNPAIVGSEIIGAKFAGSLAKGYPARTDGGQLESVPDGPSIERARKPGRTSVSASVGMPEPASELQPGMSAKLARVAPTKYSLNRINGGPHRPVQGTMPM